MSSRKNMTEEIRTKIKRKRPECGAMSGKQKSFQLSLLMHVKGFSKNVNKSWCENV